MSIIDIKIQKFSSLPHRQVEEQHKVHMQWHVYLRRSENTIVQRKDEGKNLLQLRQGSVLGVCQERIQRCTNSEHNAKTLADNLSQVELH